MTQAELSEMTNIERSYISRSGKGATVLLLDRMLRLCRRLGVELTATLPVDPAGSRGGR